MDADALFAQTIILGAPFPIAYTMRRVYEVRGADPHTRALALADHLEVLVRWCAAVVLAAYQKDGFFDRALNDDVIATLGRKASVGEWVYLLRSGLKAYRRTRHPFPIPELERALLGRRSDATLAARSIDELVSVRNRLVHGGFVEGPEIEKAIERMRTLIRTALEKLNDFLTGYHLVGVQIEAGVARDTLPMIGASTDFVPLEGYISGESPLGEGKHMLLVSREHVPVLALDPFCTFLPDGQLGMLSRFRVDERAPTRLRAAIRRFVPTGEDWLPETLMEEASHFAETLRMALDGMRRRTRRISLAELSRLAALRQFPSMGPELIERRQLFIGREEEQLRIREWIEQLDSGSDCRAVLLVTGGIGVGKTSLLANAALDLGAVFHFVASPEARNRLTVVLQSLITQITEKYSLVNLSRPATDAAEAAHFLAATLEIVSARIVASRDRPVVMIIDNLDGFEDGGHELLEVFPSPLPPRCGVVLSARSLPRLRRFPSVQTLALQEFGLEAVIDMVCTVLSADRSQQIESLAEKLFQITGGNPLLLHILLRDQDLLALRDRIEAPGDVFRLLVEKFDGRTDEDGYESFLALLSVAQEPLPVDIIADVLGVKQRKIEAFARATRCYVRQSDLGLAFLVPQIAERLCRPRPEGVEPSVLHQAVRRFVDDLLRRQDDRSTRYRLSHLSGLLASLPPPHGRDELGAWLASPEFRLKVAGAALENAPQSDVRMFLECGGDVDHVRMIFESLLATGSEQELVGALLVMRYVPQLGCESLDRTLSRLERHPSAWVRSTLSRLHRVQLSRRARGSAKPRLVLMNYLGHLPFVAQYADAGLEFNIVISDGFSERLELAQIDRAEFMASTLDEVALLAANGVEYLPFYRLLHSVGVDAIVVRSDSGISGPADLKGATIGCEVSSVSAVWLHQVLDDHGVPLSSVKEWPFVSVEDCSRALASGQLDAAVLWEPWVSASGGRVLISSGAPDQVINDTLSVRADAAMDLVGQASTLARTWNRFEGKLREADLEVVRRYYDLDEAEITRQLGSFRFIDWVENCRLFEEGVNSPGGIVNVARRLARLEGHREPFFDVDQARQLIARIQV